MKKLVSILFVTIVVVSSCKNESNGTPEKYPTLDYETQKEYDDSAIREYLNSHYFDEKGIVKVIQKEDSTKTKLFDIATKLPSGVVYVLRPDAQPTDGIEVTDEKVLSMMIISSGTRAVWVKDKNTVDLVEKFSFFDTVNKGGNLLKDPKWHYVKKKDIENEQKRINKNPNNKFTVTKDFFEIEGFKEGIKKFKSFNKDPKENYNLQGLIIVPSRAAFGKEPHFNYNGSYMNDCIFFFNFQLYKAEDRTHDQE